MANPIIHSILNYKVYNTYIKQILLRSTNFSTKPTRFLSTLFNNIQEIHNGGKMAATYEVLLLIMPDYFNDIVLMNKVEKQKGKMTACM